MKVKKDNIKINVRECKDVEIICLECGEKNIFYDVDCEEANNKECWGCGEILEFYVDDFKEQMNEEENEAIRDLIDSSNISLIGDGTIITSNKTIKTILNLIEKLQKENNELKQSKITYEKVRNIQEKNKNIVDNKYISKQKVKDKIEKEIKYHEKNILDIENITMLKSKTAKEEAEIEFNKYAIVVLKKMLRELIEESEN